MDRKLILAALLLASCGRSDAPPDLQISSAWARETLAGQTSTAAYMTLANRGAGDDRLLGASAPAPARASLHATRSEGGISRMRPLSEGLPIEARATVALAPGGTHLMIAGLQAPLAEGDVLPVTLRFERSGERRVEVRIMDAASAGPAPAHQGH